MHPSPPELLPPARPNVDILTDMFVWWNEAFASDAMTPAGFARFFTDEAPFIVNGDLRGKGPDALFACFGRQRPEVGSAILILPFLETFSAGDRIFIEYDMHIGVGPAARIFNAKGYARIKGDRIALYTVNTFAR
jgi:hypothetical protein